jgi:hypothetical protein
VGTVKALLRAATAELAYPRCVAEFGDYRSAQDAVDRLVQAGVPAHEIAVVGRNLRSVERVIARTKLGASARFGAVLGAWCGLGAGLPLLLAADARGFTLPISTAVLGALVGLLWGTAEHALLSRGGHRGYAAAPVQLVADRYEVQVEHRHAQRAREVLGPQPVYAATLANVG